MIQDDFIGPPNIYRYRSNVDFTIDELSNSYIYFQNSRLLNDPFDCYHKLLKVPDDKDLIRKWAEKLLKKKDPNISRQVMRAEARKLDLGYWKNTIEQEIEKVVDGFGVGCFSSQPSNLMLWANYSNYHKGLCLRFNIDNSANFFMDLDFVDYQEELSSKDYLPGDSVKHLFYTKSNVWRMEQEYRLIKKPVGKHYFKPEALVGIIFGKDATKEFIFKVMDACNNKYGNLKFYRSLPSKTTFGITIQEICEA
ncbi:MAG: DUF2971 domain-containing protein [Cyclobacteriaceae bacterium]